MKHLKRIDEVNFSKFNVVGTDDDDNLIGNCKDCGKTGIFVDSHECGENIDNSTATGKIDFKKYTNIGSDEDGNLLGNCTECGGRGIMIHYHKCFK
jgi:hypothetical protein